MAPDTVSRTKRVSAPSARVIDPDNIGEKQLSSHRAAQAEAILRAEAEAALRAQEANQEWASHTGSSPAATDPSHEEARMEIERVANSNRPLSPVPASRRKRKPIVEDSDSDSQDGTQPSSSQKRARTAESQDTTLPATNQLDEDGFLKDINIQAIDNDTMSNKRREDTSRDLNEFFAEAFEVSAPEGKRKRRRCLKCPRRQGEERPSFVADVSTLRRHIESAHREPYMAWCKANKFEPKLPKYRAQLREKQTTSQQKTLDPHLKEIPTRLPPYTDQVYHEAAIHWLVENDLPIQALEHPSFRNMINTAARATNGVKHLTRKMTRNQIMVTFKRALTKIRERVNSEMVQGRVSLTCDCWQASNIDAYFAVTAHWIEEERPGVWKMGMALIGFTQLNNSHNGQRLGHALYKIIERVHIQHKVGHMTCDNASNNDTMLEHFEERMHRDGHRFDRKQQHIRCIAHVVNLATQLLLSTYSKSKYYDPTNPNQDLNVDAEDPDEPQHRDEIGLVRTISIKERSSSKRKEIFVDIQRNRPAHPRYTQPVHLKNDMPVRWSSTYFMLDRAESLKEVVDAFMRRLMSEEKSRVKRAKLDALILTSAEWAQVQSCVSLLAHSDRAQQAFSSENGPSLHLVLPALEALHKAWTARSDPAIWPKYARFLPALEAALAKIAEYYQYTEESDVYTVVKFLDPFSKGRHIEKHWGKSLYKEALKRLEDLYRERYEELYGDESQNYTTGPRQHHSSEGRKLSRLFRELSDDEDDEDALQRPAQLSDPLKPYLPGFNEYIQSPNEKRCGLSMIDWWGINANRMRVWASLARDYLPIMASSVSSERAFSSAGITITKRRNRLKGDIVEALQVLKAIYRRNIVFADGSLDDDDELEETEQQGNSDNDNRRAILFADEDDGEYTEPDDEDDSEITIQSIDP